MGSTGKCLSEAVSQSMIVQIQEAPEDHLENVNPKTASIVEWRCLGSDRRENKLKKAPVQLVSCHGNSNQNMISCILRPISLVWSLIYGRSSQGGVDFIRK